MCIRDSNYTVALTGLDDDVARATDELSAISHTARSNPTQEAVDDPWAVMEGVRTLQPHTGG